MKDCWCKAANAFVCYQATHNAAGECGCWCHAEAECYCSHCNSERYWQQKRAHEVAALVQREGGGDAK